MATEPRKRVVRPLGNKEPVSDCKPKNEVSKSKAHEELVAQEEKRKQAEFLETSKSQAQEVKPSGLNPEILKGNSSTTSEEEPPRPIPVPVSPQDSTKKDEVKTSLDKEMSSHKADIPKKNNTESFFGDGHKIIPDIPENPDDGGGTSGMDGASIPPVPPNFSGGSKDDKKKTPKQKTVFILLTIFALLSLLLFLYNEKNGSSVSISGDIAVADNPVDVTSPKAIPPKASFTAKMATQNVPAVVVDTKKDSGQTTALSSSENHHYTEGGLTFSLDEEDSDKENPHCVDTL